MWLKMWGLKFMEFLECSVVLRVLCSRLQGAEGRVGERTWDRLQRRGGGE